MKRPNLIRAVVLAGLVVGVAACGRSVTSGDGDAGDASNLEEWIANIKARPAPPLDPLPVMQQFETFEYAAQGMRDPFTQSAVSDSGGSGPRPDSNRRKQALEAFSLDALDMVGSLGTGRGLVALVLAPDKITYRVQPGVYMGQNDGRVTSVSDNKIELVELVPDGAGGWLERPASLSLEDN